MEDKTFAQSMEELNQRALKEITDAALSCWATLQSGATVTSTTAHIENEYMREAVAHVLYYVLLQSLLFDAKKRQMISGKRYEELRAYTETLANQVKQQPFMVLPLGTP
ncbi:hypothetical protein [Dictyobacter formicarum]|uniref:Uncharacterized protein n=1 Tax=Dictyobacter formicarum TaxID=2778368 RepID=A0ABQ3VUH6_9CHLR|nr:hypothetical protein [Dictyobacter formicarum]GHO89527.1 hypothetical protein KSZ_75330 [Dictyobacter formicarum]